MNFIREHMTVVLGVVIAGVVIAGYVLFFSGGSSSSSVQVTKPSSAAQGGVSQELLSTLLQLHSVTLDETIWQDPSFKSLRDFGVQIAPQPIGRDNPFLPLGSRGSSSAGSGASAATQGTKPASR